LQVNLSASANTNKQQDTQTYKGNTSSRIHLAYKLGKQSELVIQVASRHCKKMPEDHFIDMYFEVV